MTLFSPIRRTRRVVASSYSINPACETRGSSNNKSASKCLWKRKIFKVAFRPYEKAFFYVSEMAKCRLERLTLPKRNVTNPQVPPGFAGKAVGYYGYRTGHWELIRPLKYRFHR